MQTSVNLQNPLTYSIFPMIIILLIMAGIYVLNYIIESKKTNNKESVNIENTSKKTEKIKAKYIGELNKKLKEYEENKINLREAYQAISEIVRLFVFEVTDIKTQNYTLSEIKKLNMPPLYEAIEEYYKPEFASKSEGDLINSIKKARRIIEKWS